MTYLYLLINFGSVFLPFMYSFEKKMRFIQYWKSVLISLTSVGLLFIIWDIIFTKQGVWGFNPAYHLNIDVFGLPIEEILFFFCIPYASLFIHYVFIHFYKNIKLSSKWVLFITYFLLLISIVIIIFSFPKKYTTINFIFFTILLVYSIVVDYSNLSTFYITFLFILFPFFIVNGVLTGSFIENEVVWYNNDENLGFRLFTIPVEDVVYAFNLLYLNLIVIEKLKAAFKK